MRLQISLLVPNLDMPGKRGVGNNAFHLNHIYTNNVSKLVAPTWSSATRYHSHQTPIYPIPFVDPTRNANDS